MRLWFGGLAVIGVVAAAFALPSAASHEQIELRIVGDSRIALPALDDDTQPIRFDYSPPDPEARGSVSTCWNGRFDRAALTSTKPEHELCSTGFPGLNGQVGNATTVRIFPSVAGRYEAVQRRFTPCEVNCDPPPPPHWNASNVVTFEVVDPCRLTLGPFELKALSPPMMLGAPIQCDLEVKGRVQLRGEDGSVLAMASSGWIAWTYRTNELRVPVLRLRASGKRADLNYRLESLLGGFMVARASTGAVHAISLAPADVSLTHRNNVTRVRVRRGKVVALGIGHYDLAQVIVRFCGRGRPTIRCLSRIRYRFFTSKKIRRARVLSAGQTATFNRPPSAVRILGP